MKVLILTQDSTASGDLAAQVRHAAPHSDVMERLLGSMTDSLDDELIASSDVIIVDCPQKFGLALSFFRTLRRNTTAWIVAVGRLESATQIVELLQCGVDSFVDSERDSQPQLTAILDNWTRHGGAIDDIPHQLVAVLSASGGNGASTLAANMAVCVAQRVERCGLVDMDLTKPDQAALLNLKPRHSLADLCHGGSQVDQNMFRQSLVKHESGVELLAGPDRLDANRYPHSQQLANIAQLARREFPVTFIDCGGPGDTTLYFDLLRECTRVFIVGRLDFTGLCHVRRVLDECERARVPESSIAIIANKVSRGNEITTAKARTLLARKLDVCLPRDEEGMSLALNCGVPLVVETPRRKLSQSIQQATEQLLELEDAAGQVQAQRDSGRRCDSGQWRFVSHLAQALLFARAASH